MEDFKSILLSHMSKYPLMKPVDAVKLCYQSAKGCGHLIKNEEDALSMLKNEMEKTDENPDAQAVECIGGVYVRMNLHKAKADGISEESICKIFIESARTGKKSSVKERVDILKELAEKGQTPFSKSELLKFLSEYNGEAVSHSEEYKKAYSPAYRVVLKELAENLQ